MVQLQLLVVAQLFLGACLASVDPDDSFPVGFMFGAATAAYQIEGGWNEDGKGENIWDHYVHEDPSRIVGNATGDIACDSYHKYKEDIAHVAEMGLTTYRFSISWSRILPSGFNNEVNSKGVDYYKNVIGEIEKNKLTPLVTLYHWDLPQSIQDLGGWTNPQTVDYFVDYAHVAFDSFPSVKYWLTFNEPSNVCTSGYGTAKMAPGISRSGQADYQCAYNLLKAHAAAYHLYKEELNGTGQVSLAIDGIWAEPASDSQNDTDAAERFKMFQFGLYANPVFIGDWPAVVKDRVNNRSVSEKFKTSRLPSFTDEEIEYINGTYDFMAVNFYTAKVIADDKEAPFDTPSFENDLKVKQSMNPDWKISEGENIVAPSTLRSFLKWLRDIYHSPKIIITENGVADDGSTLEDNDRIYYLAGYLRAVLDAIHKDKVWVHGYTFWSLLDNFEWAQGYSKHYGLYSVNFSDPDRTRTAKRSVEYYSQVAKNLTIPPPPGTTPRPSTTTETPDSSKQPQNMSSNILLGFAIMLLWRLASL